MASGKGKRKWYLRWYMIPVYFFVFIIFLSVMAASSPSPATTASTSGSTQTPAVVEPPKPVINVTAVKLYNDYKANEVAADATYKGNVVRVSGTVETIGKDILSNPYVTLKADQYGYNTVQCLFSRQDEPLLAQLTKGNSIVLQGTVSGYTILSPMVDDCQIVK